MFKMHRAPDSQKIMEAIVAAQRMPAQRTPQLQQGNGPCNDSQYSIGCKTIENKCVMPGFLDPDKYNNCPI